MSGTIHCNVSHILMKCVTYIDERAWMFQNSYLTLGIMYFYWLLENKILYIPRSYKGLNFLNTENSVFMNATYFGQEPRIFLQNQYHVYCITSPNFMQNNPIKYSLESSCSISRKIYKMLLNYALLYIVCFACYISHGLLSAVYCTF